MDQKFILFRRALFRPADCSIGNQKILINHNGDHYRLRITKNDKLIVTK